MFTLKPTSKPHWDQLDLRHPGRAAKPFLHPIIEGYHSESHSGVCRMLATPATTHIVDDLRGGLRVLAAKSTRGRLNMWWDLDSHIRALFRHDSDAMTRLYVDGRVDAAPLSAEYVPGKLFVARDGGRHASYHYNATQFYRCSLTEAATKYLPPIRPDDVPLGASPTGGPDAETAGRCRQAATQTRDLSRLLIDRLHAIGAWPRRLISPGYVAANFARQHGSLPTWRDFPHRVNFVAWLAFRGGWTDNWRQGSFSAWQYDIRSAYPSVLATLPDTRDGEWREELIEDSPMGFVRAVVRYRRGTPPVIGTQWRKLYLYPHWSDPVRCWVTLAEWRVMRRLADVQVERALCFVPREHYRQPYEASIRTLLAAKEQDRGDPHRYAAAKTLVNSLYGKLVERIDRGERWRAGRLFAPAYGATVTGSIRARLTEAAAPHPENVVAVNVDGMISRRKLDIVEGDGAGEWQTKTEGADCVLVRASIYQMSGGAPKSSGFRLSASLADALRGAGTSLPVSYRRAVTAREAILAGRPERAGIIDDHNIRIPLANQRRLWVEEPRSFRDLLDHDYGSVPVPSGIAALAHGARARAGMPQEG